MMRVSEPTEAFIPCAVCGVETRPWMQVNTFALRTCSACKLKFVHPLPDATHGLYSHDYFFGGEDGFGYVNYDEDKRAMFPMMREYLELIRARRPEQGTLLDVGAATGVFVSVAQTHGWRAEGIEIAPAAVAAAQQKGIPVRESVLSDVEGLAAFDAVTFLDVLEHLPDPLAALRDARRLLRDQGVIAVNVPDAGSLYARLMGKRWHAVVPPEHLWYFTQASLSRLLADAGFTQIRYHKIAKSFSLPYFIASCARWFKWPWLFRAASRLERSRFGRLQMWVPLYDNVFVIAEAGSGNEAPEPIQSPSTRMPAWIESIRNRSTTIGRLFKFLWKMKMWWLMPLVIILIILSLITIMAASTPLGPFIYAIF